MMSALLVVLTMNIASFKSQSLEIGTNTMPNANNIRMAIGYYHPYVKIIGGFYSLRSLVQFDINSNDFIDNGTAYFSNDIWEYGQFWTQIKDNLLIIHLEGGLGFDAYYLDTNTYESNWNSLTIPILPSTVALKQTCITFSSQHNFIYVVGGRGGFGMIKETEMLNLTSMEWITNPPPLLLQRSYFACNVHEDTNTLFAIAGAYAGSDYSKTIEYLDISDMSTIESKSWQNTPYTIPDGWQRAPHTTIGLYQHSSVVHEDIIYLIGGQYQASLIIVDVVAEQVTIGPSFLGDLGAAPIIIENVLYVFGGNTNIYQYYIIPTGSPTSEPTPTPTNSTSPPSMSPTYSTSDPTDAPTMDPTLEPTADPSKDPTIDPTIDPTVDPTADPTSNPTDNPTSEPTTAEPSMSPVTDAPSNEPSNEPSMTPSDDPTVDPTIDPTKDPTENPTDYPTNSPTEMTEDPTSWPTSNPTTAYPTASETYKRYFRVTINFDFEVVQAYVTQIGSTMNSWALGIITNLLEVLVNQGLISISIIDVIEGSIIVDLEIESKSLAVITQAAEILNGASFIYDTNGNFTLPVTETISYTTNPTHEPTINPTISDYVLRQRLYGPELEDLTRLYQLVAISFTSSLLIIGIIAFIDACCIRINDYFSIGALLAFFMQTMDMISDCFFIAQLNIENKIELDTTYTIIFYVSILFIVLPAMTALFQLYFHSKKHWLEDNHTRSWLRKFSSLLLILSIITGSSFAATNLLNSYLFQLEIFDMGLTQRQLKGFNTKRVYSIVILEVCICITMISCIQDSFFKFFCCHYRICRNYAYNLIFCGHRMVSMELRYLPLYSPSYQ